VHPAREQYLGKAYWRFWWVQDLLPSREDTLSVFDRFSYYSTMFSKYLRQHTKAGLKDPQIHSSTVSSTE